MLKNVSFTGGKGGTGKSTLAVNVAALLAREHDIVLADMDVECPNDHILLSVPELKRKEEVAIFQPIFIPDKCTGCGECREACAESAIVQFKEGVPFLLPNLCSGCRTCQLACRYDAIADGRKTVGNTYLTEYSADGISIKLITGILNEGEERSFHVARAAKNRAENTPGEIHIFDTPAGTTNTVAISLMPAEALFAVCEPTPLGIHDLGMIMELAEKMNIRHRYIIINKSDIGGEEGKISVMDLAKSHGVEIIAEIPYSREIIDSYMEGRPYALKKDGEKELLETFEKIAGVIRNVV